MQIIKKEPLRKIRFGLSIVFLLIGVGIIFRTFWLIFIFSPILIGGIYGIFRAGTYKYFDPLLLLESLQITSFMLGFLGIFLAALLFPKQKIYKGNVRVVNKVILILILFCTLFVGIGLARQAQKRQKGMTAVEHYVPQFADSDWEIVHIPRSNYSAIYFQTDRSFKKGDSPEGLEFIYVSAVEGEFSIKNDLDTQIDVVKDDYVIFTLPKYDIECIGIYLDGKWVENASKLSVMWPSDWSYTNNIPEIDEAMFNICDGYNFNHKDGEE